MKNSYHAIIALICLILLKPLYAGDLFNSFIQESPSIREITHSGLDYHLDHIELLRESRNDTLLSRYAIRRQYISYTQELKILKFDLLYTRDILELDDILNSDYTHTNVVPKAHTFGVNTQFEIGKHKIRPGFKYSFSGFQDTLFIKEYPSSETKIYNDYFFDLIPSTFGDSLIYKNLFHKLNFEFYIENFNKDKGYSFYGQFVRSQNKLSEDHFNSGDVDKLAGPRSTLNLYTSTQVNTLLSLKLSSKSIIDVGLDLGFSPLNWSHTVFPNDPDTLEIITLTDAKLKLFSCKLTYRHVENNTNFKISLHAGHIDANAHLATPVLGYLFGLLPIAHQGDFDLNTNYFQTITQIDYIFELDFLSIKPRLDLLGGLYTSHLDVLALLQFGIEDIDIQEKYLHFALLASPGINTVFNLNSDLFMYLDISQLIPIVKQLSPEPTPIVPDGISRYGGLSVSLGVGMEW